MVILNRILNVLILLLAVAALAFGYLLFQKRDQMRAHSVNLAKGMSDIAQKIDPSGDLAKQATFTEGTGEGTLGFENADKIGGVASAIAKRATDLLAQRDVLGDAVAQLNNELVRLPDEEQLEAATLQDLAQYDEATKAVLAQIERMQLRNAGLSAEIAKLGQELGVAVDQAKLMHPDTYQGEVTRLRISIVAINNKLKSYREAVETVVSDFGQEIPVDPKKLGDPDTALDALTDLRNAIKQVNTKLEAYERSTEEIAGLKETIDTQKRSLGDLQATSQTQAERIENLSRERGALGSRIDELVTELDALKGNLARHGPDDGVLDGQVVNVDYEWQNVIINIGKNQGLDPNLTLTVKRGREYIGNVFVTQVFPNFAVAEILPEQKQGEILQGDQVFFMTEAPVMP